MRAESTPGQWLPMTTPSAMLRNTSTSVIHAPIRRPKK